MKSSKTRWDTRWIMLIIFITLAALAAVIFCEFIDDSRLKKPEHDRNVNIESGLICFGKEGISYFPKLPSSGNLDVLYANNEMKGEDAYNSRTDSDILQNSNSKQNLGGLGEGINSDNPLQNPSNLGGVPNHSSNEGDVGAPEIQEPVIEKIWVVDKPAWTEKVSVPIYSTRPTWFIWFKDGSRKVYYDKEEWIYDCKYAPDVSQWGRGKSETYISGYEEKIIEHPEEGHWEYR